MESLADGHRVRGSITSVSVFADKPRVSLRLGKSLDPDNLRTGNDVYFECDVRANPIPHKLVWLHRVSGDKKSAHIASFSILINLRSQQDNQRINMFL